MHCDFFPLTTYWSLVVIVIQVGGVVGWSSVIHTYLAWTDVHYMLLAVFWCIGSFSHRLWGTCPYSICILLVAIKHHLLSHLVVLCYISVLVIYKTTHLSIIYTNSKLRHHNRYSSTHQLTTHKTLRFTEYMRRRRTCLGKNEWIVIHSESWHLSIVEESV